MFRFVRFECVICFQFVEGFEGFRLLVFKGFDGLKVRV